MESVARAPRSVLMLDYDGTLAPFPVERQQGGSLSRRTPLLQRIVAAGSTRVLIVTGRDTNEIAPPRHSSRARKFGALTGCNGARPTGL